MLAEIKLEAVEWFYMEVDYAVKHGLPIDYGKVFEKTLDTAMRDLNECEYVVWCYEILSRYERQMMIMDEYHLKDIEKAVDIYGRLDFSGLSEEEKLIMKKDHKLVKDYLQWVHN